MTGTVTVVLVAPEREARVLEVEPTTLEVYRKLVGGPLEWVGGHDWSAYLSQLRGRCAGRRPEDYVRSTCSEFEGLPVNRVADGLARSLGWSARPGDVLVGPVVFLGKRVQALVQSAHVIADAIAREGT